MGVGESNRTDAAEKSSYSADAVERTANSDVTAPPTEPNVLLAFKGAQLGINSASTYVQDICEINLVGTHRILADSDRAERCAYDPQMPSDDKTVRCNTFSEKV